MRTTIEIHDLKVLCNIGVSEKERMDEQPLLITCRVTADFSLAMERDSEWEMLDERQIIARQKRPKKSRIGLLIRISAAHL